MPGILITQCLQNDFVQPLGKYDPLPNLLHVGYGEARRLMGENPDEGPVDSVIEWAYKQPEEALAIVHIRDWHDPGDPRQEGHLAQFGQHCVRGTLGAEFVFARHMLPGRRDFIVNATGLNDFEGTGLANILESFRGRHQKVGIMGVWTEAKVLFLAYELSTRYPEFEVGICSALTASSSRQTHFLAVDQARNILGASVFPSVGAFTRFLAGSQPDTEKRAAARRASVELAVESPAPLREEDRSILTALFRDCGRVELKCLDGGFSGNVVMRASAVDILGHRQVPTVVKIGDRDSIAEERTAFERIQEVMGNNAPAVVDFAEIGERGGIKYRYASMMGGRVRTIQDIIEDGAPDAEVFGHLDTVFRDQLGRLYDASDSEKLNLLDYYDFRQKYAPHVRHNVEAILGKPADGDELQIMPGLRARNIVHFYERDLVELREYEALQHFMAYVHGDLNGKNILVDAQNNVWLIDFFHTHRGHILRDLLKFENDLLYIFTKIETQAEFKEAVRLTDLLLGVPDLGRPPEAEIENAFQSPKIRRAFRIARHLRGYYPRLVQSDRDPYQLHAGLLRYAVHTLSFDECSPMQKKWALYSACVCAMLVKGYITRSRKLRFDTLDTGRRETPGKIALTILPGRKDRGRDLAEDVGVIRAKGVSSVLCLVTEGELAEYGVPRLREAYAEAGIEMKHFPVLDQSVPSAELLRPVLDWMDELLKTGETVLVHCVGGLGRSGLVAASYLKAKSGFTAEAAISRVREARGARAVENADQEAFVRQL